MRGVCYTEIPALDGGSYLIDLGPNNTEAFPARMNSLKNGGNTGR